MAASQNSTIKGLTASEYDKVDLPTLRFWRRYWEGKTRGGLSKEHAADKGRIAAEISKLTREIDARVAARDAVPTVEVTTEAPAESN